MTAKQNNGEYVACEDYSPYGKPWSRQPDDDDWCPVRGACDAESASEIYASKIDRDGEYTIVSSGEGRIWVKSPDGEVSRWNIFAESVPHYSGSPAK